MLNFSWNQSLPPRIIAPLGKNLAKLVGGDETESFMFKPHSRPGHDIFDAKRKLLKYYNNCTELFVEEILARGDFESPYFHFEKIHMSKRSENTTDDLL